MADRAQALAWIAAQGFRKIDLGVVTRFCPHANPENASNDDFKRLADEIAGYGLSTSTCSAWSLRSLNGPDGPKTELTYLKASLRMAAALGEDRFPILRTRS